MKIVINILLLLCLTLGTKCQNIYSAIHLNEERDVHQGIPKSIKEFKTFYNSSSTEIKRELTEYDHSGLPFSNRFIDEDGNTTIIVTYKYDTTKRRVLESNTTEVNVRFHSNRVRTLYSYEDGVNPTRIQYFSSTGEVLSEVLLKNNSFGFPIELKLFEPPENLLGTEIASYIPEKNKAVVSVLNKEGQILSTDTITISFKNAHNYINPHVKYNDKGDLSYAESRWLNGSIHYNEYDYVYDTIGNWTDQKSFEVTYKLNGKKKRGLKAHFTREIVYWKE